jgi:hypothetical protein
MLDKRAVLEAAASYLKDHPEEILRFVRNAITLRFGVPLDALRWLAGRAKGKRAPRDVVVEAVPPGIRLEATLDLMATPVRVSAVVYVEHVRLSSEELRFELRLAQVSLQLLDPKSDTPIAALIKSGALDLSKPGNLVAFMPKRPPVLVEAHDDRIVLDLKRLPKLQDGKVEKLLGLLTPIVSIDGIQTDRDHLDVLLRPFPDGLRHAVAAIRVRLQGATPSDTRLGYSGSIR